jgi:hypothetical protein
MRRSCDRLTIFAAQAAVLTGTLLVAGCTIGDAPCALPEAQGACEDSSDCADAQCRELTWEFGSGGICTRDCESELDCVSSGSDPGRCLRIAGGAFQCYSQCRSDGDCPPTWVCQPVSTGGRVCLP